MILRTWNAAAFLLAAVTMAMHARASESAETLSVALGTNRPVPVDFPVAHDDRRFTDPRGYNEPGKRHRIVQQRLTIENTGSSVIRGLQLSVNGRDWGSVDSIRTAEGWEGNGTGWAREFFQWWTLHRCHASSGSPATWDPVAMLTGWSYTLCGDDVQALGRFFQHVGIPARSISLNGHVAAEFLIGGKWQLFDGDQNLVYPGLDNQTLASARELREDPFLILRSKPFGRYTRVDPGRAWFNLSLFEIINPRERKEMKLEEKPSPPRGSLDLHPYERVIFHSGISPERPSGFTDLSGWPGVREKALSTVEFCLRPETRQAGHPFTAPWPILEARNATTGTRTAPASPVAYSIVLPAASASDDLRVVCQISAVTLPLLKAGQNTVEVRSRSEGRVQLQVEYIPPERDLSLPVVSAVAKSSQEIVALAYSSPVDRIWWQIASERAFRHPVAPNFDEVSEPRPSITLDPLTATFLDPDRPYFFRCKAQAGGVWGDWCEPVEFRVSKPSPPRSIRVEVGGPGALRVFWDARQGEEYLVFGSNRLDFLPEIYTAGQVEAMDGLKVTQTVPNANQLAKVSGGTAEIRPIQRFLRVVALKDGTLSNPSRLIRVPRELTASLPPARVLQSRATRTEDPAAPGGIRDRYLATPVEVPD